MSGGPPRALLRALEATLPGGLVGRSMVGDLVEEWHGRPAGPARLAWFAAVVAGLVVRYAFVRAARVLASAGRATLTTLRGLPRSPLQTGFTVLALGVGIAAPATMYSIVAGITRDVAVEDIDRLVQIGLRYGPTDVGIAPLEWLWPAVGELEGLEAVGVFSREFVDLSDGDRPAERVLVGVVTPGVFGAFGVGAALGRTFSEDDDRLDPAPVVLGWTLWRNRFGARRDVVGRTVRVDGRSRVVVGVMPEGFRSPGGARMWGVLDPADPGAAEATVEAVGRLAPGASLPVVQAQLDGLDAALVERGEEPPGPGGGLAAQSWRHGLIAPQHRRMLTVMLVVVSFVLVIACADVLNLLLARALARSRETAVRAALGAGRARIVGEHLAEAAVLSILGGVVGLGLTALGVHFFRSQTAGQLAHWMEIRVDLPVLAFGAGMVALAALGTGLAPAVQSGRMNPGSALRDGGRGSSAFRIGRLSRTLVAGEVALSCALLVMSGIMVKGALANLHTDGTYPTADVLTAQYEVRPETHRDEEIASFHRRVVERLREHPGVAEAALSTSLPGVSALRTRVELEESRVERPENLPRTHAVVVSPGFFEALDGRVLAGRALRWTDGSEGSLPVVVNEAFAREHLGGREPLGARLRIVHGGASQELPWATVVGVAPQFGIGVGRGANETGVYLPASTAVGSSLYARRMWLVLRAEPGTDPLELVPSVRREMATLDRDMALFEVGTLEQQIRATRAVESVFSALFLLFGVAGLLLAGVGLYGVIAFGVRRRLRELGVRTALGATPWKVLGSAAGGAMAQLAAGLAVGLTLAALVSPLLGELLLGMDPRDPTVYLLVTAVLGATGLAAGLAPARRALSRDVVDALRAE